MKKALLLITLLLTMSACADSAREVDNEIELSGFEIRTGLNVSHWLSQSQNRGEERENYMQAEDFKVIADMGFDHIRLPIDEEQMWDEEGNKHEEAFELMHKAIQWSFENKLRVIVDLHILRSHHFNMADSRALWDDPSAQQQFWSYWEELSDELVKYPIDSLAYELMNEAVADDPEDWNNLIAGGISAVRAKEPNRTIVVGSNRWQMTSTFKDLRVPKDDKNLILSFHFYDPFLISHYRAGWTGDISQFDGKVNYPGLTVDTATYANYSENVVDGLRHHNGVYNKEVLEERILLAIDVAEEYGLPLYCGEYGMFPTTPIEMRTQIYQDLTDIFNKYDIARTHWNYKNDFPVVDAISLEPINEIVSIITQ